MEFQKGKRKQRQQIVNVWFYISSSEAIECDTFGYVWLKKSMEVWNYRDIQKPTTRHNWTKKPTTHQNWTILFFFLKETWSLKRRKYQQDTITEAANVKHILLLGILLGTSKSQMPISAPVVS